MKHFFTFSFLILASIAHGQLLDAFTYSGALSTNGWTSHSGTAGQFSTLTTASDLGNSLSYTGLAASTGNRTTFVAGNGEDVNKALTGITGTGYYSFLMKVTNTTGLNPAGDYFTGFGQTAGASVTVLGARTFIKPGATAGTFLLGIQNTTGGTPTQTYTTTEYPVGTTLLVVIKFNRTAAPVVAELFVNPVPGAAEPAATISNSSGTATFTALASIFFRQNGNATSGTGNIQIDEIRTGSTWAAVTPGGCATVNNFSATACGSYTLNGTTYNTSGTYSQVLTNANAAGCDSTINVNLTINQPTTHTINASSCGTYTLNGTTYNTTGTYTQTLTNANSVGCDSTITLNLSIVASVTYYADADGDGFGNAASTTSGCSQPVGYVTNADDCDDSNNAIGVATVTYYADADGDTFGSPAVSVVACTAPAGYVTNNTDCNDANNAIGVAQTFYADADGDGYGTATTITACTMPAGYAAVNGDCNDANNAIHPGATEIPDNGIDEDCSGADLSTALGIYEFTAAAACPVTAIDVTTQPANATFGQFSATGVICAMAGNVFNNSDWNTGATVDLSEYAEFTLSPAACQAITLTGMSFLHRTSGTGGNPTVHVRSSVDGYAADLFTATIVVPNTNENVTNALPAAFTGLSSSVTFRFYVTGIGTTGATYRLDNVAVNGSVAALPMQTYYADVDGDSFGNSAATVTGCTAPVGYVTNSTDCNDNNAQQFPGAIWFQDLDGDLFGNAAVSLTQCTQPAGYVSNNTDCNDNDNTISGSITYYADADGDTFGDAGASVPACSAPAGYVLNDLDCDDNNAAITIATQMFYEDFDNDGFGEAGSIGLVACSAPAGYVADNTDCDDNNNAITGPTTTFYVDADGDGFGAMSLVGIIACTAPAGYVADNTDCDDANAAINPDAVEITGNGIDENCDQLDGNVGIDEVFASQFTLFPNPGSEQVTIAFTGIWNNTVAVTVLSAEGKEVAATMFSASDATIVLSTAQLVPGMYLVKLTDGSKSAIVRWVKN